MHHFFTKTRLITSVISSFSLLIFSIVLAFVIVPLIIDNQIDKNVRLERGTEQWHRFIQLPFNVTFNVTLFAVENVDDVVKKGSKPILREQGPYVFDEIITRKHLVYNDNNNSVTSEREIQFYFNESKSGPDVTMSDTITMINPVYLALMQVVKDINLGFLSGLVDICMNQMFNNTPAILKDYPVKDLLFDGINICDYNNWKCKLICGYFAVSKIIEEVKNGKEHYMKFSLFNYKRVTYDGIYEVNTGIPNIAEVGKIEQWNYSNITKVWNPNLQNNSCNRVTGTDGSIFPPHLSEDYSASIYSTDICRTVAIHYNGTGVYKNIDGYIYKPKPSVFYSTVSDPSQDCYCAIKPATSDEWEQPSCFLDGIIDIYPCLGLPVLVSFPHFLYADSKYFMNLTGDINPDPEKHEITVLLDKYTGAPLQAHKRVQLNLMLRPSKSFPSSKHFPRTVLPLCWIDEGLDLPDSGIELLDSLLYNTLRLVNILKWILIGVFLALTVMSVLLLVLHYYPQLMSK